MGDILEYICLKVCLLSASFVLSNKAPKSLSHQPRSFRGGFIGLISGKNLKMCFFFFFLSVEKKKKINWHTRTHTHLHPRFPQLTIFYLLVNVPNYSVKHCQRFAAWHAYWNGNATVSKWKSFIHWLLSGFIHDNLLSSCRITLMRGLKGGVCVCVCVCVAFLCFHARGTLAPERKEATFRLPPALSIIHKKRTWFGFVAFTCSSVCTSCYWKGCCQNSQRKQPGVLFFCFFFPAEIPSDLNHKPSWLSRLSPDRFTPGTDL